MAENSEADKARPKRAKARSGCVRCRAKRRKCDEVKPVCGRCKDRREGCQWGTRIVFREENNHGLGTQQRSIKNKKPKKPHLSRFEIQDITAEVIRDHQQRDSTESASVIASPEITEEKEISRVTKMADSTLEDDVRAWEIAATLEIMSAPTENGPETDVDYQHNLDIGLNDEATGLPALDDLAYVWPSPSALGTYDDSIFLPGSAYLDAHFTLRSHLIQEVHTGNAIRVGAPESLRDDRFEAPGLSSADFRDVASQTSILAEGEEFQLLQNWVEEVAPWMDKFDSERHFQHTLPIMARSHSHLRFSILAASARQLERKERSTGTDRSLALYQQAIQLVLPELHTRSTAVIASCVVLCVLEMQSSSPKAWRQHLDGCAHLIQASGINGFSGGIDQALFWCFARMDVCGGLITSMSTLIPMKHWTPGTALAEHTTFFGNATGFNAHACYAVYICGKVLELFSHKSQLASRVGPSPTAGVSETSSVYASRWAKLWRNIDDWYHYRPDEMMPIHYVDAQTSPFPKILYSNPAAISGNQLHHTACILMLQHKPSSVVLARKPRSIFWHARQACAISISNHHHGAWTNSIQPLWIAGQWMSHPSEQKAILELLERIERETGWGTKGRAEDLKDFWGD